MMLYLAILLSVVVSYAVYRHAKKLSNDIINDGWMIEPPVTVV